MDQIDIANLALGYLAVDPLTSLDDPSTSAERVKGVLPALRDVVLADRDWSFAIQRRELQIDPTPPLYDYPSRYQLPATVLRVISAKEAGGGGSISALFADPYTGQGDLDWIREGAFILADTSAPTLLIRSVETVEDPMLWSPGFCHALAARIGAELCVSITQDPGLAARLWALYQAKLVDASVNDGRQGRSQRLVANRLKRARWGR